MIVVAVINLGVVIVYLLVMVGLGIWLVWYVCIGDDYFIVGRLLNCWVICGSVMVINVVVMYLVGPVGNVFREGVPFLLMVWSGNMLVVIVVVTFLLWFWWLGIVIIIELL